MWIVLCAGFKFEYYFFISSNLNKSYSNNNEKKNEMKQNISTVLSFRLR